MDASSLTFIDILDSYAAKVVLRKSAAFNILPVFIYTSYDNVIYMRNIVPLTILLIFIIVLISGCTQNNPMTMMHPNTTFNITCIDSDNGKNIFVKGTTTDFIYYNGVLENSSKSGLASVDSCVIYLDEHGFDDQYVVSCTNEDYPCNVREGYCYTSPVYEEISSAFGEDHPCPNGCRDGACINETY